MLITDTDIVTGTDTDVVHTDTVKLNLGAGSTELPGFTNIDRRTGGEVFPLDYDTDSVDEIRASHILEHFSHRDALRVLAEWVRVLRPDVGILRLAVPDLEWIAAAIRGEVSSPHPPEWYLFGAHSDENDYHGAAYTRTSLTELMWAAGLECIESWQPDLSDCSSLPCSLNLQGRKKRGEVVEVIGPDPAQVSAHVARALEPDPPGVVKIAAAMSVPRVGWNDNWGCTLEALAPFGIPVRRSSGVFWGQCMQNIFADMVRDGVDWILTIDYDTLFTAQDIDALMGHFGAHPEIDALAALQPRRQSVFPLMTVGHQKQVELTDDAPVKVTTAHFGLTLIRAEALQDIAMPWFKSEPGPDGTWTHDDHLDDDIWFWHQWRLAGKTIFVAPDVRIGHLELMVSEFADDLTVQRVFVPEWRAARGLG